MLGYVVDNLGTSISVIFLHWFVSLTFSNSPYNLSFYLVKSVIQIGLLQYFKHLLKLFKKYAFKTFCRPPGGDNDIMSHSISWPFTLHEVTWALLEVMSLRKSCMYFQCSIMCELLTVSVCCLMLGLWWVYMMVCKCGKGSWRQRVNQTLKLSAGKPKQWAQGSLKVTHLIFPHTS